MGDEAKPLLRALRTCTADDININTLYIITTTTNNDNDNNDNIDNDTNTTANTYNNASNTNDDTRPP